MIIHVVSAGETLWQIANHYFVPIQEIIQLNGLSNPDQLVIGQSLVIPSPYTTHTVKKKEILYGRLHNNTTYQFNLLSLLII